MARKSTDAEFRRRVQDVFRLRLGGAEFEDLRQYASDPERGWNVSDRQLWRYIQAADLLCKEYFDARAEHLLSRHLLQRRQLYAHAMSAGDFRTALAVLKDEAMLENLYPARKPEPTGPGDREPIKIIEVICDEARVAALDRLYARVGQGAGGQAAGGQHTPG